MADFPLGWLGWLTLLLLLLLPLPTALLLCSTLPAASAHDNLPSGSAGSVAGESVCSQVLLQARGCE